jgi:ribosome biogenesis GTPase
VELYRLPGGALIADTPGFASFCEEDVSLEMKQSLPRLFREFIPYLGSCRFSDCAHVGDEGCSILKALREGAIAPSRHESYTRLRLQAEKVKNWRQ